MGINMKNAEGYHDPTPHEALSNITREEKAAAKAAFKPLVYICSPFSGDIYRRTYWNIHGRKEFVWRCVTRIEQGPEVSKNRTVKEDELYGAVMTAINKLLAGANKMIKTLEENIHAVIGETTEYQISEINNSLEEKQKELIKLANKGQDYEHLADEIDELRDKRQTILVEDASLSGENERIDELIEFIRKNKFRTLEYDDKLVRKIIQNVTVYEDHFVISFKSGIEMEI